MSSKDISPHFLQRSSLPPEETAALSWPGGDEGLHLRDYWRVCRKHLWLIAAFFLATVTVVALFVLMMTPIYTATTTVLIERRGPQVLNIQQALTEPLGPDEYDYYRTQYEILKNRSLAAQVIRELGLEHDRFFTGEEKEAGLVAGLWSTAGAWVAGLFAPSPPQTNGSNPLGVKPELIDAYLARLEVDPVPRTRLVKVAFSTPDPALSAWVANAHARAYIRQGLELRTQANEEAVRFLEGKLVELKERVEKSETALNSYRRDKGIISLDDKENIVVERLADLNSRLTEAEAERIALEAQVRLIRKRDYDSLPAVIGSTLIQTLKEQLTRLEGEYAYLSTQFKPGYSRVAQLQAQIEETRRRLQQEIQQVVGGIESAYLAAEAREKELRAKMDEQKAATLGLKDASVGYAILAREVDTNRQLYDSVLQRMKEMGVAAELRASNVSVIEGAEPPRSPSKPQKKLSLVLSALVGLMGGVGVAFFLEYLDNTLNTPEEVEQYLRLPSLAVVPDFVSLQNHNHGYAPKKVLLTNRVGNAHSKQGTGTGNGWKGRQGNFTQTPRRKELVLSHHPLSVVTEAYRTLRTGILLSRAGEPARTILFTSGTSAEGKTATTVNTAVVFAQMRAKVLVIDADLHHPRCHKVLGVPNGPGLVELLTGQLDSSQVIKPMATENLFLLRSGAIPPNPADLVGSDKMQEVLALLQESYDYVFIDSPPVLPVTDAVLLSTMVDGVVLVVAGQETPKYVVKEARARLGYARAKILGVVLNRVNVQRGDYAYYYHHYYSYYHEHEKPYEPAP